MTIFSKHCCSIILIRSHWITWVSTVNSWITHMVPTCFSSVSKTRTISSLNRYCSTRYLTSRSSKKTTSLNAWSKWWMMAAKSILYWTRLTWLISPFGRTTVSRICLMYLQTLRSAYLKTIDCWWVIIHWWVSLSAQSFVTKSSNQENAMKIQLKIWETNFWS